MPLTPRPPSARGAATGGIPLSTTITSPLRAARPTTGGGVSHRKPARSRPQPGQCSCLVQLIARQRAFCSASSEAARRRILDELRMELQKGEGNTLSCMELGDSPCRNECLYLLGLMQLQLVMVEKALQTLLEVDLGAALDKAFRFRVTLTLAVCFSVLERRNEAEKLLSAAAALAPTEGENWMVQENRRLVAQYLSPDGVQGFHRTPMEERLGQFYFYSLDPLPDSTTAVSGDSFAQDSVSAPPPPQQLPTEIPSQSEALVDGPDPFPEHPKGSASHANSDRLTFLQELSVNGCDGVTFKRFASGKVEVEASFACHDRRIQQFSQSNSKMSTQQQSSCRVVVLDSVCETPTSLSTSGVVEGEPPLAEFAVHSKRARGYWSSQSVAALLKALEAGGAPSFAPGECLEKSDLVEHCVKHLSIPQSSHSRQRTAPLTRHRALYSTLTDSQWTPSTLRRLISEATLALRLTKIDSAVSVLQSVREVLQHLTEFVAAREKDSAKEYSLLLDHVICLLEDGPTDEVPIRRIAKILLLPIQSQGCHLGDGSRTAKDSILALLSEIRTALTLTEPTSPSSQTESGKPMTVLQDGGERKGSCNGVSERVLTNFLREIDRLSFLLRHFNAQFVLQSENLPGSKQEDPKGTAVPKPLHRSSWGDFELPKEYFSTLPETSTTLSLTLSRSNLVKEVVYLLMKLTPKELLRPFNVKLHQETAIDGGRGGVLNDVIDSFLRSVLDQLHCRPTHVSPEMGRAVGKLLFKCFVERRGAFLQGLTPFQIRFIFEPASHLLTKNPAEFLASATEPGQPGMVSKATMQQLEEQWFTSISDGELWQELYRKDQELFRSVALVAQCDNPTQLDQLDLWWTMEPTLGSGSCSRESEHRSIRVTMENKWRFIRAQLVQYLFPTATRKGLSYIRDGFCLIALQLLPKRIRSLVFADYEFVATSLGLSSSPETQQGDSAFPAANIVQCLEFHGWTPNDATPYFLCVWLHEASVQKRRQFLRLCTGSSTIPKLNSVPGPSPATDKIRVYRSELSFSSRTCFWQLNLPPFTSIEQLREALSVAINALELDPTMAETVPA